MDVVINDQYREERGKHTPGVEVRDATLTVDTAVDGNYAAGGFTFSAQILEDLQLNSVAEVIRIGGAYLTELASNKLKLYYTTDETGTPGDRIAAEVGAVDIDNEVIRVLVKGA